MSVVLPHTPVDLERWTTRDAAAHEPVSLSLTRLGWSAAFELARSTSQPNHRCWTFNKRVEIPELIGLERPDDRVDVYRCTLDRWWDRPLTPGGPMAIASTRTVTTDRGRVLEVHTTSTFGGVERTVALVLLQGPDWFVRVMFENTPPDDVDAAVCTLEVVESR